MNLCYAVKKALGNANFARAFIEKGGMEFIIHNYCYIGRKCKLSFTYLKFLKYIQEVIATFYVP